MSIPPPLFGFIRALYNRLLDNASVAEAAFAYWYERYMLIHGAPERKRLLDRRELARAYDLDEPCIPQLLFAIECAYTVCVRLQAARLLADDPNAAGISVDDAWFRQAGLIGFPAAHPFDWWIAEAGAAERRISSDLLPYLPDAAATPGWLHALHHRLVPRQARHALGIHYTPIWLAEYILETLAAHDPQRFAQGSLLDPTCGAGTFLVIALRRILAAEACAGYPRDVALRNALARIVGVDLDPLAVLAAQTSLLAAIRPFRESGMHEPVTLPIIHGDILAMPESVLNRRFDLIVGNPPWVNWEYLPPATRAHSAHLWSELGLFDQGGLERAYSKEDIAGLIAGLAAERYLASGGLLGLVLPQSLFKSALNGRGFRRFQLRSGSTLGILHVDDLRDPALFAGGGRAAVLFARRDQPTQYPVIYRRWRIIGRSRPKSIRPAEHAGWPQLRAHMQIDEGAACPADSADTGSGWIDGPPAALALIERLTGANPYRARTGMFTGGANGVFYLELLERRADGLLRVRNIVERTRRQVPQIEALIEADFVFPLLRGREVSAWSAHGGNFVLCPHTAQSRMHPVPPLELSAVAPHTLAYLEHFREALDQRRGFAGWEQPYRTAAFYACQRIGNYTFAPYKVVWRYIAPDFRCCVVVPHIDPHGLSRPVIPHEKLMLLAFDTADEAFFVCGLLSSSPARWFVESRMISTQIAPHVITRLALPRYDVHNPLHRQLAEYCRAGHQAQQTGDTTQADACRIAIDHHIPGILPITHEHVAIAQACVRRPP